MENNNTTISSTKNDFDNEIEHIIGRSLPALIDPSNNVGRSCDSANAEAQRSLLAMAYIKAQTETGAPEQCDIVIDMDSVDAATGIDIDIDFSTFTGTYVSREDFDVVLNARDLLAEIKAERNTSKCTPPSAKTIASYKRKCDLLDHAEGRLLDPGTSEWMQKLAPYAPKTRSFFSMRAAAQWRALDRLQTLVNVVKDLHPDTQTDLDWKELHRAFKHTLHQCNAIRSTSRDVCLNWSGQSARSVESKKQALRQLPDDWRDQFMEAIGSDPAYRSQTMLMRLAGFRPQEMATGVKARLIGSNLELEIAGAKVRAVAGQEWRRLNLQATTLPRWLLDELADGEQHVYKAGTGAMRKYLSRVSERLFPRKIKNGRKIGPLVSAYVLVAAIR